MKKQRSQPVIQEKQATTASVPAPVVPSFWETLRTQTRWMQWLMVILAVVFYANSIPNQFALDDAVSITENKVTLKGIAGIPDLLTKDSFYGFLGEGNDLAGGRYRPLALITFAIEQSLWNGNPHIAHAINVFLYALCGWVLIGFLRRQIFPDQPLAVLLAGIIFMIHPIHTEVVANIKSRDELLSLLFLLLSLQFCYHWIQKHAISSAMIAGSLFFLSLLAKETAIPFLGVAPLLFWYQKKSVSEILKGSLPVWIAIAAYLVLRFSVTGFKMDDSKELLNNPYLNATFEQKYATIFWVLGKYIWLLFFPVELAYDYSFNQIPLKSFSDPAVLISIGLYLALLGFAFAGFVSRNTISLGIWWYLAGISLVSNLVLNVGAPMGERFLFQPSIGFAVVIGLLLSKLSQKQVLLATMLGLTTLSFARTVTRNTDWKDEQTLLIRDIEKVPNSARACNGAGVALIKLATDSPDPLKQKEYYLKSIEYLNRGNEIYPGNLHGYLNLGVSYSRLDSVEAAERCWNLARAISPNFAKLKEYDYYLAVSYKNRGASLTAARDSLKAFESFRKSLAYDSTYAEGWFAAGLAYGTFRNFPMAVSYLQKATELAPQQASYWENLGGAAYSVQNFSLAKTAWQTTLQLDPANQVALQGMSVLPK